jgi:hypothetical protein
MTDTEEVGPKGKESRMKGEGGERRRTRTRTREKNTQFTVVSSNAHLTVRSSSEIE